MGVLRNLWNSPLLGADLGALAPIDRRHKPSEMANYESLLDELQRHVTAIELLADEVANQAAEIERLQDASKASSHVRLTIPETT